MPRKWLAVALVLPLIAIALGIVRAERHLAGGTRWVFEITGYDPRDLLRGHYIQYRLALHETEGAVACDDSHKAEPCCLCLTRTAANHPPQVQRTTCEQAQQCDGSLQTRYLSELTRYYIAEERAQELTDRVQDSATRGTARLSVILDGQGKPQIDALLVDGQRIEQTRSPK
jgi:uncharacterized membrane-anchored protein